MSTNAKYSLNVDAHPEGGTELAEMDGDDSIKQDYNQPQSQSPDSA